MKNTGHARRILALMLALVLACSLGAGALAAESQSDNAQKLTIVKRVQGINELPEGFAIVLTPEDGDVVELRGDRAINEDGVYTWDTELVPEMPYMISEVNAEVDGYALATTVDGSAVAVEGLNFVAPPMDQDDPAVLTITNSYIAVQTIKVQKVWDLAGEHVALPDSVRINLMVGEDAVGGTELTAEGGWAGQIENVPVYDENGTAISYSLKEEPVDGFVATVAAPVDGQMQITGWNSVALPGPTGQMPVSGNLLVSTEGIVWTAEALTAEQQAAVLALINDAALPGVPDLKEETTFISGEPTAEQPVVLGNAQLALDAAAGPVIGFVQQPAVRELTVYGGQLVDVDWWTVTNTYQKPQEPPVKETATLIIRKAVTGVDALPEGFAVEVTDEAGDGWVLTVGDNFYTLDEETGAHVWTIEAIALGEYVIRETGADVDGCTLTATAEWSNGVDWEGAVDGENGMTAAIAEPEAVTLSITNAYETEEVPPEEPPVKETATLIIRKAVTGVNALPEGFAVKVTDEAGDGWELTVGDNFYTLDEETGEHVWTLEAIALGEYVIRETGADVDGYTLTATAEWSNGVDSEGAVDGENGMTAAIAEPEAVTLSITNAYEPEQVAPGGYYELEIPLIKRVVTTGNGRVPEEMRFRFEIVPWDDDDVENWADLILSKEDIITVTERGDNECVLRLRIETREDLSEVIRGGLCVREVPLENPLWTCDESEWYLSPWSEVDTETGALEAYGFSYYLIDEDGTEQEQDAMIFVNTYRTNGGGHENDRHTLFYESNGGTVYPSEIHAEGEVIQLDKRPIRAGHTFTGWYTDKELTNRVTKLTMPGKSVTVYAGWSNSPIPPMLNAVDHFAYMIGYEDGTVRPNGNITRAEVAQVFYRLLTDDGRTANRTMTNSFTDVPTYAWYCEAVSTMAKLGLVNGRTATEFVPDAPITRAEFATICVRFDKTLDGSVGTFHDVVGHWAEGATAHAAALGWVTGYEDGSFQPDAPITRAEAVTIINRVLHRLPETPEDLCEGMRTFPDNADPSAWYYLAIQEAGNSHFFKYKADGLHEKWTGLR